MKYFLYILSLVFIVSCSHPSAPVQKEHKIPSLQAKLDEKRDESIKKNPEVSQTFQEAIEELREDAAHLKAVMGGDKAPDFTLPNQEGKKVHLYELLKKGPVVLQWYRGGWCPYCNIQLRALNEALDEIKSAGGTLVAISPQLPDQSVLVATKNTLRFDVLSDVQNKVAKKYNLVVPMKEKVGDILKQHIDFKKYHGDDSMELPFPASYVIDQEGNIQFAFIDPDYKLRAEPQDIIDALKAIAQKKKPSL